MDPLSVSASIAGLLSAAGAVARLLNPYIAAARDTPKVAVQVGAEVHEATIVLSALQRLAQNMASVSIQHAALVTIDQVVAVLTDGVLVFSDLEASVGSLPLGAPSATPLAIWSRLQWARKESDFVSLLSRLQGFKSSISLILNILQRHVLHTINLDSSASCNNSQK
jgi:cell division control protein 24